MPEGAYNIRANGKLADRVNSANIEIVSKEDGTGIDIHIKPGTKKESVHIPVVLSQSGLSDLVYNDFYVGDDADVVIVAGCGIHNGGDQDSRHDGIHRFWLGKNAKVKYVEKHYGEGDGKGKRILNPVTEVTMDENSYMERKWSRSGCRLYPAYDQSRSGCRCQADHPGTSVDPWRSACRERICGEFKWRRFQRQCDFQIRGEE